MEVERRKHQRYNLHDASVFWESGLAKVLDASFTGALVESTSSPGVGEEFNFRLHLPSLPPMSMSGHVVRVDGARWAIRFDGRSQDLATSLFLARFLGSTPEVSETVLVYRSSDSPLATIEDDLARAGHLVQTTRVPLNLIHAVMADPAPSALLIDGAASGSEIWELLLILEEELAPVHVFIVDCEANDVELDQLLPTSARMDDATHEVTCNHGFLRRTDPGWTIERTLAITATAY